MNLTVSTKYVQSYRSSKNFILDIVSSTRLHSDTWLTGYEDVSKVYELKLKTALELYFIGIDNIPEFLFGDDKTSNVIRREALKELSVVARSVLNGMIKI